jgi:hypothetical protein
MTASTAIDNRGAFDRCPFSRIEATLAADPQAWIETRHLMAALEWNAGRPIPALTLAHLRARLDGTAKKRRGRGRPSCSRAFRDTLIAAGFEQKEAWLNARLAKQGLKGWSPIRDAEWWQGPPSERAARMVLRRWEFNLSWETVRNIAYKIRKEGMPTNF